MQRSDRTSYRAAPLQHPNTPKLHELVGLQASRCVPNVRPSCLFMSSSLSPGLHAGLTMVRVCEAERKGRISQAGVAEVK